MLILEGSVLFFFRKSKSSLTNETLALLFKLFLVDKIYLESRRFLILQLNFFPLKILMELQNSRIDGIILYIDP